MHRYVSGLLLLYVVDSVLAVLAELELRSNYSCEILVEFNDPLVTFNDCANVLAKDNFHFLPSVVLFKLKNCLSEVCAYILTKLLGSGLADRDSNSSRGLFLHKLFFSLFSSQKTKNTHNNRNPPLDLFTRQIIPYHRRKVNTLLFKNSLY